MSASISNPPNSAAHPRRSSPSSPSPAPSNNAFSNAAASTPTPFQVPHQTPPTPSSSNASSTDSPSPPPPPTPGPRALMNNSASTTQAAYQRLCPSRSGPQHGAVHWTHKGRLAFNLRPPQPSLAPQPTHPLPRTPAPYLITPSAQARITLCGHLLPTKALVATSAPPPPSFQHRLDLPSNSATACYHIHAVTVVVPRDNDPATSWGNKHKHHHYH
jgi:hypothetical protein